MPNTELDRYDDFLLAVRRDRKRIVVCGERMMDLYHFGRMGKVVEGVPVFEESSMTFVAGAADNVAEQLRAWNVEAVRWPQLTQPHPDDPDVRIPYDPVAVTKKRFLDERGALRFISSDHDGFFCSKVAKQVADLGHTLTTDTFPACDGIIVSDYGRGWVTNKMQVVISEVARVRNIPVVVDPPWQPPEHCPLYGETIYVKMNREQWDRRRTFSLWPRDRTIITDGPNQPKLMTDNGHVKAINGSQSTVSVVDVAGGGDHFAAVMCVGLCHGLPIEQAANYAHQASKLRVAYRRPRPILPSEVRWAWDQPLRKCLPLADVVRLLPHCKPVAFTNGVFSLPTAGHGSLFDAVSSEYTLIVGINSDASALRVKGHEPLLPLDHRMRIVANHPRVDFVVAFDEDTPAETVKALAGSGKIAMLVKGAEYRGTKPPGSEHAGYLTFIEETFTNHGSDFLADYLDEQQRLVDRMK